MEVALVGRAGQLDRSMAAAMALVVNHQAMVALLGHSVPKLGSVLLLQQQTTSILESIEIVACCVGG